jgi:hypothetical protein
MVTALACLACLLTPDATPESTVKGVVDALNNHDWKGVFSRFEGAKLDLVVPQFTKLAGMNARIPKFFIKMTTLTTNGDMATGPVSVGTQEGTQTTPNYVDDEVHLHRVNGDWKISDGKTAQSMFTALGEISRNPEKLGMARDNARRTVILSDMKQIGLAVLMFANDFDDKLSFTQSTMKAKLQPYLKNDKLWVGPDGKPLDVRINPAWVGKSMTAVSQPANCVMLSIGPKDKLQYFDGQTPIVFMDGHAKFLTSAAAKNIMWK